MHRPSAAGIVNCLCLPVLFYLMTGRSSYKCRVDCSTYKYIYKEIGDVCHNVILFGDVCHNMIKFEPEELGERLEVLIFRLAQLGPPALSTKLVCKISGC